MVFQPPPPYLCAHEHLYIYHEHYIYIKMKSIFFSKTVPRENFYLNFQEILSAKRAQQASNAKEKKPMHERLVPSGQKSFKNAIVGTRPVSSVALHNAFRA